MAAPSRSILKALRRPPEWSAVTLERYQRRTRLLHMCVYLLTFLLFFTGLWLLEGREGQPSPLARALGMPDTALHTRIGWALVMVAVFGIPLEGRGAVSFVRETFRFDRGDLLWFVSWPWATITGRFARHEGRFDPGQRLANLVIVGGLGVLFGSGAGLTLVHGGATFLWLYRVHKYATYVMLPILAGHILIAVGILPGYRGVWRAMHLGGRVPVETARRVWPGWTERRLQTGEVLLEHMRRYLDLHRSATPVEGDGVERGRSGRHYRRL